MPSTGEYEADIADLYTPILGQTPGVDELLGKMQTRIERELAFERELVKLRGALDMTLSQAAMTQVMAA